VELYTFRRDSAKTAAEKVEWQKSLVTEAQEYATDCQKRVGMGVMTSTDQLRAKEQALAAEQLLIQLQDTK
jgi:outer membrane protein TolC